MVPLSPSIFSGTHPFPPTFKVESEFDFWSCPESLSLMQTVAGSLHVGLSYIRRKQTHVLTGSTRQAEKVGGTGEHRCLSQGPKSGGEAGVGPGKQRGFNTVGTGPGQSGEEGTSSQPLHEVQVGERRFRPDYRTLPRDFQFASRKCKLKC